MNQESVGKKGSIPHLGEKYLYFSNLCLVDIGMCIAGKKTIELVIGDWYPKL
jgi:hypothetical protein